VQQNDDRVAVHAWGRCHPEDCDWGNHDGFRERRLRRPYLGSRLCAAQDDAFCRRGPPTYGAG
jgi:hypothetical protein